MGYSKEDIMQLVEENDVKFIRLQFTDIFGVLKNMAVTVSQLEKALNNECMFDGSSIEGFVGAEESDMYLKPDLDTFVIFPWRPQHGRVARFICDIYLPDGTPFEGSPRYVLKKALSRAKALGYELNVGPECEFFLFKTDDSGKATTIPHDDGNYFSLSPMDGGENTRREICLTLEDMGYEIEASHHEMAKGQHEVDFRYEEALRTADNIMTFKFVVKTIAQRNGLYATFMPKPIFGMNGSGMHTNVSLSKNGVNIFYDEKDKNGLSKEAYSFIAGILKHMKAMAAITNPLVNSYKRLVPGFEAPVYLAWSRSNRSPLIRVPAVRGKATRIELRSPDAACNPYLELAVILNAGLDGIENNLIAPESIESNLFDLSQEECEKKGMERLPENLGIAIAEMEKSQLVKNTIGNHIFENYLAAKKKEWTEYLQNVSQWEINQYLGTY